MRSLNHSRIGGMVLAALTSSCSGDLGGLNGTDNPTVDNPGTTENSPAAEELCASSDVGAPLLRRLTSREFTAVLNAAFPEVAGAWAPSFTADAISTAGFDNQSETLVVSKQMLGKINSNGQAVAASVVESLSTVLPCSVSTPDRTCAAEFASKYGKRLYRRPLSAVESEEMLAFYDEAFSKTDFPSAIGWLTRALIHSPHTVYRRELGTVSSDSREFDQFEIATALSFAFSGSSPSDELLLQAENGELSTAEARRAVALSLSHSPAGREHLHRFFEGWLEYTGVQTTTKVNVPEFEGLRPQMVEAARRYIEAVVLDGTGGLAELLTSAQAYPSIELASFLGLPVPSADYAAVTRPETAGIGILSHSAFLAHEASSLSSSPTQRGLLLMEKFLCLTPPTVPNDVPEITEPVEGVMTTRELYEEVHAASPGCSGCHEAFDPMGFAFEHYDEAGRYRADEGGLPIDSSGHVPTRGENLFEFAGQAELAAGLADESIVQGCVSGQLKVFGFASEGGCLGENERAAFMNGEIGFVDYFTSFATEPQFVRRRLN